MNLYNAIMKAADHIERDPESYNFGRIHVPDCGTQGCMLGWIGFYAGVTVGSDVLTKVGHDLLHEAGNRHSDLSFYDKLGNQRYTQDVRAAVSGLRLYAETYWSHQKPKAASDFVANLMARVMTERIPEDT